MTASVSVIEVLGPGCDRCHETYRVVRQVVDEAGLDCVVRQSTSIERMLQFEVLSFPAVVFDGKVLVSGRIPKTDDVRRLLGLPSR